MPKRTITLDTGSRQVEAPVDALGRERFRATLDSQTIERRADGEPIGFKGHAAMFNKATQIGPKRWGFREQVAPGAFAKTIGEADVRMLINHDPNLLLARNKAGTLTLSEDRKGLKTEADMAPVSYASDLAVLLERKDITQMSFAFEAIKDQWETDDDGNELRTLLEVKLYDVSVVTYPAYEETDAGLRGAGFDILCRSMGIADEDARQAFLRRLMDDETDILPILRTAGAALTSLRDHEPAKTTREDPSQPAETTGDLLALIQRRHSYNARRFGIPA